MTAPVEQYQDTPHDQSAAAILGAYLAASAALRSRLLALVVAAYAAQGNYRDTAADAFVAAVVPAVLAAQHTMASLTSAYLSHLVSAVGGGTTAPMAIPQDAVSNLRGVDPAEVYRRPYVQVWTDLSQGKSLTDAVQAGQRRALNLAATDVQLAKMRASQLVMRNDKRITGYRRVLTGAHSCALCVLASTRWYSRGDLSAIHPGCDCSVQPLFNHQMPDELPAEQIHAAIARDLGDKYVSASGKKGAALYKDIVVVHDHGELGPVLGVRGQNFVGPSVIPGGE